MKNPQLFFLAALAILLVNCTSEKTKTATVASPDGKNKIQFEIKEGVPYYSVNHAEINVVNPSKLGFVFKNDDTFNSGFTVADVKTSSFDETWEQVWGEKHLIQNKYNELVVTLQEKGLGAGNKDCSRYLSRTAIGTIGKWIELGKLVAII